MLIRCEKCATLYELDDNMLPPGGAPVQCSRCQHVFTAYPERRADGGAAPSAAAPEEGVREGPPPDGSGRAAAGETDVGAAASTAGAGEEHLTGERAEEAGWASDRVAANAETAGARELASSLGEAGAALSPAGEGADGAAELEASATGEGAEARAAAAGGARPRTAPTRGADGRSSTPRVNDGAGADDEPKFTADGRPIRKVPFPDDPAALSPRTASARPSLQTAPPRRGERARLPWLVPVILALVLAFVAVVAWRILAARSAGGDASQQPQPAEGHSSLLNGGRPEGARGAEPAIGRLRAIAASDGKVRSHSCPRAGG